ncbi:TetR/AcrR family transcriptional regulator [Klenkia terrae]|uniref:TetR/AcrR family transcriptional regulator n=1 Tax=Klenkia terrae TaxID=1052259 RepID=UPI003607BDD8
MVVYNRTRILDVALEVLGQDPDAAMADIAAAAGVVRRTVYGHFPSRTDLVLTLTRQAAGELSGTLADAEVEASGSTADTVWAGFVGRVWPLARRYRLLLALRRGEHGPDIHALLAPVEETLADLVRRGQDEGCSAGTCPRACSASWPSRPSSPSRRTPCPTLPWTPRRPPSPACSCWVSPPSARGPSPGPEPELRPGRPPGRRPPPA